MRFFRLLVLSVCVSLTLALATRVDALDLYASTASGHAAGELYILDSTTGAVVQDIGPLNDASSLNYGMTGLAFDPVSGVLYGSSSSGSPNPAAQNKLVTINPATGLVTVVGPYGLSGAATGSSMADLAFDPTTDVLYGIGTVGGAHLYSINTSTGQATLVGDSGFAFTAGGGVAVSPTGIVFGSPAINDFGTYDKVTGAYTNISNPAKPAGGGYGALAFEGSVLFGLNLGTPPHLVTIDAATGMVTDVAPTLNALDAIAFRPTPAVPGDYNRNGVVDAGDYDLWRKGDLAADGTGPGGVPDGVVNGLDYNFWRARFGNTSGSGLASSAIPEPNALLLLVSAFAALGLSRRTRLNVKHHDLR